MTCDRQVTYHDSEPQTFIHTHQSLGSSIIRGILHHIHINKYREVFSFERHIPDKSKCLAEHYTIHKPSTNLAHFPRTLRKLGLEKSLVFVCYSISVSECTNTFITVRCKNTRLYVNNFASRFSSHIAILQKKNHNLLCRVLGSMRWTVLVTLMHTQIWLMLPRLCASFGDRHTTLSCMQREHVLSSHFFTF